MLKITAFFPVLSICLAFNKLSLAKIIRMKVNPFSVVVVIVVVVDTKFFSEGKIPAVFRHICLPPPTTFCGDVVRSMKRWKIIKENNLTVETKILDNPQNVENFLREVQSKWDILHGNCHCKDAFIKELEKGKKFTGICWAT